jgi:hypothetical protein
MFRRNSIKCMFSIKNLFFILTLSFFWTEPFKLEAQSIPTKGLILWVPFNGNLSDESINRNKVNLIDNNSGTIVNEVNLLCPDRFGNASNAINFNGKAENNGIKISLTEPLVLDDRTISFWMKSPVKLSTLYGNLFEIGFNKKVRQNGSILGNEPSYILQKRVGKISCLIPEGGYIESKSYLNDENWHHFVFVVNTNEKSYKIFIDGQFDSDSYLQVPVVNNSNPYSSSFRNEVSAIFVDYFIFGNILRNNNECAFDGFIDDIGVWNRVLNNSEISQLYNNFYKPESRPIVKTDERIKHDALPSSVLFKNNPEATQIYRNENITSSSNSICEINSSWLQQINIFSNNPVIRYFGECKNGFPNGYGKALLKSGSEIHGIFNSSSLLEGPIKYVESGKPSTTFTNWTNTGFDGYTTKIEDTTRFTASSSIYKSNQWKIYSTGGIDTSIITKLNELNFDLENNAILDYGTSNSLRIPNSNFYLVTNKHQTASGSIKPWYSLFDTKTNTKISDIGSISTSLEYICYSSDYKFIYFKQQNAYYKASVQTGKLILCDKLESQTITSLFKNLNNNEEYGKGYTMYGSSTLHFNLDRFIQKKNYYSNTSQPVDSSKLFIYSISGLLKRIEYIKAEIVSTYISSNKSRIYVLLNSYDSLFVSSYNLTDLSFEKNILSVGYLKNKLPNLGGGWFQLGASLCVSSNEKYVCINESIFKNNSIFYAIPGFIGFSNDESTAFSSNNGVFSAFDLSAPKLRWYLDYARTYNRLIGDKKKMIIANSNSPRLAITYNLNDNELHLFCSDKEFKSAHLVIKNIQYREKPDNDLNNQIASQMEANSTERLYSSISNSSSECKSLLQDLSYSADKILEIARKGKNNLLNFDAIAYRDERLKMAKSNEKIKSCISKFNSSEKQEYSDFQSKVKESNRLFDEIMLIVKSVNSTPYTSNSQTSSRSTERRWNYICQDCNKIKVLESGPYDNSFCPETRWGGVGKTSFAEGKHEYRKIAKYGSTPYACSTCGISISTDGKIISSGVCAATGNSHDHKWQK